MIDMIRLNMTNYIIFIYLVYFDKGCVLIYVHL